MQLAIPRAVPAQIPNAPGHPKALSGSATQCHWPSGGHFPNSFPTQVATPRALPKRLPNALRYPRAISRVASQCRWSPKGHTHQDNPRAPPKCPMPMVTQGSYPPGQPQGAPKVFWGCPGVVLGRPVPNAYVRNSCPQKPCVTNPCVRDAYAHQDG